MKNNQKNVKSDEIFDGFERGIVKSIEDDYAIIILQEHEACQHCHAKVICKPGKSGQREVKLKNTIGAQKGDKVLLESSDKEHIKLTFMQYGIPLLGFFLGLFLSYQLIDKFPFDLSHEVGSFLSGLVLLGVASFGSYIWCQSKSDSGFAVLQLREIVTKNN
mgnify:CR=1 FL=1